MTYVISDIHGCYAEFLELLEKIRFTGDDDLYVLGDVVDRGDEPIKLVLDLMERPNVSLIMGNHEFMMLEAVGGQLSREITDELISELENDLGGLSDRLESLQCWLDDGGSVTLEQYRALSPEKRRDVLDYIGEAPLYELLEVNGRRYVLAHSDLHGFNGDIDGLSAADLCMHRADYSRRYFSDENTFLVTGHTPTKLIRGDRQPLVFEENGHIAIDCGCVFGGKLAAYCLETGEKFYADKTNS